MDGPAATSLNSCGQIDEKCLTCGAPRTREPPWGARETRTCVWRLPRCPLDGNRAAAAVLRDNPRVDLSSARQLKHELVEPLAERGGLQPQRAPSVSLPAERASEIGRIHPGIALGIAPGTRRDDYRLAVRIQHRDFLAGSRIDAIIRAARNDVDVQYVGLITKRADVPADRRARPVVPGVSVGHYEITAGTLGAIVRMAGDDRARILSNNHVLADENRGAVGDEVLQPGAIDGGVSGRDRVGALERFVALYTDRVNTVDAALAVLDPGIEFDAAIPGLGEVSQIAGVEDVDEVAKVGRTTGLTRGRVTAIEVDGVAVRFSMGTMRFDGQVEISGSEQAFSAPGDSGSLIVDPQDASAVALLFAGSDQGGTGGLGVTYANPLTAVFEELSIEALW